MQKLFETIEKNEVKKSISYIYIRNKELRVTYHMDDMNSSYWENSDYYNSNEIVDSDNFWEFLKLDYRERDLSDTIKQDWYFLIWEKVDVIPDYIVNFLNEYYIHVLDHEIKEIKRTFWNKKLLFVKLDVDKNIIDKIKRNSKEVTKILENIIK